MSNPFDALIFIGRFQPFHVAHQKVIEQALKQAQTVVIVIGSAKGPRAIRNPFNFEERQRMILGAFGPDDQARIFCVPVIDTLYNDERWLKTVQQAVGSVLKTTDQHIGLIGHDKDSSSYYLSLFPTWSSVSVPNIKQLSATPIRDQYLLSGAIDAQNLPASTQDFLGDFISTPDYAELKAEAAFCREYRAQWDSAPYPPVLVTSDALLVQAGHILLIERKHAPGAGLLALPGGFLDQKETLFEGCMRELFEETQIELAEYKITAALHAQHTFDDPYRSARGRTITQVFYFRLPASPKGLPKVCASDDAACAFWLPLSELNSQVMFEDHYAIIVKMLGI